MWPTAGPDNYSKKPRPGRLGRISTVPRSAAVSQTSRSGCARDNGKPTRTARAQANYWNALVESRRGSLPASSLTPTLSRWERENLRPQRALRSRPKSVHHVSDLYTRHGRGEGRGRGRMATKSGTLFFYQAISQLVSVHLLRWCCAHSRTPAEDNNLDGGEAQQVLISLTRLCETTKNLLRPSPFALRPSPVSREPAFPVGDEVTSLTPSRWFPSLRRSAKAPSATTILPPAAVASVITAHSKPSAEPDLASAPVNSVSEALILASAEDNLQAAEVNLASAELILVSEAVRQASAPAVAGSPTAADASLSTARAFPTAADDKLASSDSKLTGARAKFASAPHKLSASAAFPAAASHSTRAARARLPASVAFLPHSGPRHTPALVGRGVLTAPPRSSGIRVFDGGLRTARPTHPGVSEHAVTTYPPQTT